MSKMVPKQANLQAISANHRCQNFCTEKANLPQIVAEMRFSRIRFAKKMAKNYPCPRIAAFWDNSRLN